MARPVSLPQLAPGFIFRCREHLGRIAECRQFAPGIELQHVWRSPGDERYMRGLADLRHLGQCPDIGWAMVERVVADEATERRRAEGSVAVAVDFFEDWALIPADALEPCERAGQCAFGDIEDLDLDELVGGSVADEIVQPAPSTFQAQKLGRMQD